MAYVINLPGLPPISFNSVQEYNAFAAKHGIPPIQAAPAPTSTGPTLNLRKRPSGTASAPSGKDPCTIYEDAKKAGQAAVILNALNAKCKAYQTALADAQAFAAPGLNEGQLAIMADQQMAPEETGMSTKTKIAIAAGALIVVGGIAWYATR